MMAMQVQEKWVGVDVAKDELVVASSQADECIRVVNHKQAIGAYLETLSGPVAMAIEATSVYHLEFVEQAYRKGHTMYLIDGYRLKRINEAEGDVARFSALLAEYSKAPEVTRRRIYIETLQDVMPTIRSKIIVDEQTRSILPLLNLDAQNGVQP